MANQITILSPQCQKTFKTCYAADYLARHWKQRGHCVSFSGINRRLNQDGTLFLHVDLSVVPADYREFVAPHPRVVNRDIVDIRKATVSRTLVSRADDYQGPVIIKTPLNSTGHGEYRAQNNRLIRLVHRLSRSHRNFRQSWPAELTPDCTSKYALLDRHSQVPDSVWDDPKWVVERFQPEKKGDNFVLREWFFLGEREFSNCEISPLPIFSSGETRLDMAEPPPPQLREWRREMQIDFGKIDYALAENGAPILYDVNKTPTLRRPLTQTGNAIIEALVPGIEKWFA